MKPMHQLLAGASLFIVGILFMIYRWNSDRVVLEKIYEEFRPLTTLDSLNNYVTKINYPLPPQINRLHSVVHITLNDSNKFTIEASNRSSEYLDSVVIIGVHVMKKPGSNHLTVTKINKGDTILYDFILLKSNPL